MFFCSSRQTSVAVFSWFLRTAVFFCAMLMLFFSCATPPPKQTASPLDFFAFFLPYEGAPVDSNDLYAVIPVAENENLLRSILSSSMPEQTISDMLSRTQTLYLAVTWKNASFKVAAEGNFPKAFAPFIFSSLNGWEKVLFSSKKNVPKSFSSYYQAYAGTDFFIQAALPTSGLILASSCDMRTMLEHAAIQPIQAMDLHNDVRQLIEETPPPAIRFFIPGSRSLLPLFLGVDITLPVTFISGTCTALREKTVSDSYLFDLYLQCSDARFVRPTAVVLRKVLQPFSEASVTIVNNLSIKISNLKINIESISGIL